MQTVIERPILLVGEEFASCPECGTRLIMSDVPVGKDEDGEIHEGHCNAHGNFLIQEEV